MVIGNNCTIAPETTLGPYAVIGDDWTIERKASISNSVLWKRYSYFPDKGNEIPVIERKVDDMHQVRRGVTIDECIIVGGTIEKNLREKTVDIAEDGSTGILSIDHVPEGKRA